MGELFWQGPLLWSLQKGPDATNDAQHSNIRGVEEWRRRLEEAAAVPGEGRPAGWPEGEKERRKEQEPDRRRRGEKRIKGR